MYRAFGGLLHTVRTGETAFEAVYGQPLFDYYASHPDAEAIGSARMTARPHDPAQLPGSHARQCPPRHRGVRAPRTRDG